MKSRLLDSETHGRLVQYLLGGLSPSERDRMEEEYFVREESWEALAAVENDLIDAYAKGHLPDKERRQFEEYFLQSPRKQQRLGFARDLMDAELRSELRGSNSSPASGTFRFLPRQAWQWLAAAAALAIVAILTWQNHQLRNQVGQLHSEQQQASRPRVPSDPANISVRATPLSAIAIALSPGLARSGGESVGAMPVIHTGSSSVVLMTLNLEHDRSPRYDAVLKSAEGMVILKVSDMDGHTSAGGLRTLTLAVPSNLLVRDDYILKVFPSGGHREAADSYAFSVLP